MVMSTDWKPNGYVEVSRDEWLQHLLSIDANQITENGKVISDSWNYIIEKTLSECMKIRLAKVMKVNPSRTVDLHVAGVTDDENEISWSNVPNYSVYQDLQEGDTVVVLVPQEKMHSNVFIIGVGSVEFKQNLADKLVETNRILASEVNNLNRRIDNLQDQINRLRNLISNINTTTTT